MPRIRDKPKTKDEIKASLQKSEADLSCFDRDEANLAPLKEKVEPQEKNTARVTDEKKVPWSLLYVLIAIAVFGLGLLVIALMNLGIYGTFSI